jgi:hypothetical protein
VTERTQEPPESDRDRRARLEALQAELAEERARVDRAGAHAVAALEAKVADARTHLAHAEEQKQELERQAADLAKKRRWLEEELEDERVRARGRARNEGLLEPWRSPFLELRIPKGWVGRSLAIAFVLLYLAFAWLAWPGHH